MNAIDPTQNTPTVQPQPVPALNFADLRPGDPFPWVKQRTAPPGWAVVFPAAALHMVSMVTKGRRYAFLPFVYDEAGAAIRQRNLAGHADAQTSAET